MITNHPTPIFLMMYVLTTSVDYRNQFLEESEILHMNKKQNKAVPTQITNGDLHISDFMLKIFVSFYIEHQYLLFGVNGDCRRYNSSKNLLFEIKKH